MYESYKRRHGSAEFYVLKVAVRSAGLLHRMAAATNAHDFYDALGFRRTKTQHVRELRF
jgi:hypothetical protein